MRVNILFPYKYLIFTKCLKYSFYIIKIILIQEPYFLEIHTLFVSAAFSTNVTVSYIYIYENIVEHSLYSYFVPYQSTCNMYI